MKVQRGLPLSDVNRRLLNAIPCLWDSVSVTGKNSTIQHLIYTLSRHEWYILIDCCWLAKITTQLNHTSNKKALSKENSVAPKKFIDTFTAMSSGSTPNLTRIHCKSQFRIFWWELTPKVDQTTWEVVYWSHCFIKLLRVKSRAGRHWAHSLMSSWTYWRWLLSILQNRHQCWSEHRLWATHSRVPGDSKHSDSKNSKSALSDSEIFQAPPSSEYGTSKTVEARLWPWLSGKSHQNMLRCSLFTRQRHTHPEAAYFGDPVCSILFKRRTYSVPAIYSPR